MSQSRQLAAIMFTDLVGYAALMGEDEQAAFDLLKKNRTIQRSLIEKFHGKWIKEIGDGVLASFPTVSDAVYCAASIQKSCENEPDLQLRIGIHLGEVVFEGDDVFGDGVNIASRLEPLAPVGGILVSESVHRNLGNKRGINTELLREEQLKNVKGPVKIYSVEVDDVESVVSPDLSEEPEPTSRNTRSLLLMALGVVIIAVLGFLLYSSFQPPAPPEVADAGVLDKSIVVLPFSDLSQDGNQEYFSDGMMEEILNHLARIPDLTVISRTTAIRYKGTTKSASEIADDLGVATVLEGSVRKDGNQLRINVQLIEGVTDSPIWSQSFDREMTNVFQVQSDVAQRIAEVLKADIDPEVKLLIEAQPTSNVEAYDMYMLGRYHWYQRTGEGLNKSIDYFEQALEIDPDYALAYAGLSDGYVMLVSYANLPQAIGFEKAKKYAMKALELNEDLSPVQATLGTIARREWNWQEAEMRLLKAIELDPDYLMARHWYVEYLFVKGSEEAVYEQIQEGIRIDPFSFLMQSQLADYYLSTGELEKAIDASFFTLELDPYDLSWSYDRLSRIYYDLGDEEQAFSSIMKSWTLHGHLPGQHDLVRSIFQKEGMKGVFEWWVDYEVNKYPATYPPLIADLYMQLDKPDLALDWLEISYDDRIQYLPEIIRNSPIFKVLKKEPRFQALLKKMDLD